MDRLRYTLDTGGQNVLRTVATQNRNVTGMEPFRATDMKTGQSLRDGPWPFRIAPCPASGADNHDIAGLHLHASFLFPRVQILRVNRSARLQVVDAFVPRHVHQYAACDNAVLEIEDRVLARTVFGNLVFGIAVIHLAIPEKMA